MIYIVDVKCLKRLKEIRHLNWVYIGSVKGLGKAKTILVEDRREFIARDIENITDSVRDNFVDYIGKLSLLQDDKVLWYSSRMASKSMSQTSIFHQYIYQKLLEKLAQQSVKDSLVVTDDNELLENSQELCSDSINIIKSKDLLISKMQKHINGWLSILKYCFLWFIFRFLKNKYIFDFDVFIHSWIDERTFKEIPEFKDSYFGNINSFLNKKGAKVGRLTPLSFSIKHILRLRRHFSNIVYPLSYLYFADLRKVLFTKFNCSITGGDMPGIKDLHTLQVLAQKEIIKENISKVFMGYLMSFYSYKKLSSMINQKTLLIYPFENQPWEKMFNLAFKTFNRIGYQHSTIPINFLDYRISKYEKEMPLPKVIFTSGKRWTIFLKKHYSNVNTIIKEAGAFRFSYLFKRERFEPVNFDMQLRNIVVALPIVSNVALSLQKQLLEFLKNDSLESYCIRIKPHPYLLKSAHLKKDFAKYENCKFTQESISVLLENCSLFITSNSVSVTLESLCAGVKTLYLIPEEISFGINSFIKENAFIAYEDNFSQKFKEALTSLQYPNVKIEDCFSQPNYNAFSDHLTNCNN